MNKIETIDRAIGKLEAIGELLKEIENIRPDSLEGLETKSKVLDVFTKVQKNI